MRTDWEDGLWGLFRKTAAPRMSYDDIAALFSVESFPTRKTAWTPYRTVDPKKPLTEQQARLLIIGGLRP